MILFISATFDFYLIVAHSHAATSEWTNFIHYYIYEHESYASKRSCNEEVW